MQIQYDAIIVGAGLCGGLCANELAAAGLKILVLEAGHEYTSRHDYLHNYYTADSSIRGLAETPYPVFPQAPFPKSFAMNDYYVQHGPKHERYDATYLRMVGGTTLHWLGTTLRMHPNDFKLQTLYNVGKDWPLSYEELEPWYCKAETILGVSGDSTAPSHSPRSKPYPMPEIPMSYLGLKVKHATQGMLFDGNELIVIPTPQARNSIAGYQNRPACVGNHSCIPICPIQAKYDALVHINKARAHGAQIQAESVVHSLEVDEFGNIAQLNYLRWDGSKQTVRAKIYIIAAHGIESPKLLLNSRHAKFPHGIANRSDQVGRNLMDHPSQLSYALANEALYPMRSPLSTSGIESIADGPFRKKSASFRVQISDTGWSWPTKSPYSTLDHFLERGYFGAELEKLISENVSKQISLNALLEMLPQATNRVTLDDKKDALGIPRPRIHFKLDDYTRLGLARARELHTNIFNKVGVNDIKHFTDNEWVGSGHIIGTLRMGNNPNDSVVDKNLRSHDHKNLFVLGSSVFPSSACVNPSLTIAALTLRTAEIIKKYFNVH
ncbi:MAG: GMC family oxidoreductase [Gammaproteobacteria bacterium]|nr:GMC family oxidoreductase [Gammaproteobacteria bacterium]